MFTRWTTVSSCRVSQAIRNSAKRTIARNPLASTTKIAAAPSSSLATAPEIIDHDITPFFNRPSASSYQNALTFTPNSGLFGQPELASPQSFSDLACRTVTRAKLLVERIHRAPASHTELLKVVKNFDRLSDMLCGVIDAAELIRHSHPDKHWVNAANEVYESLCSYMNVLNTDVTLYKVSQKHLV